jgi:hypothetical protein
MWIDIFDDNNSLVGKPLMEKIETSYLRFGCMRTVIKNNVPLGVFEGFIDKMRRIRVALMKMPVLWEW